MIEIYSIKEISEEVSFAPVPIFVAENTGQEGYYTLLAVDHREGEEDSFAGMAQFYVGITAKNGYYANITYVYVTKPYRLQDVGYKLIQKVNEILTRQQVDVITADIPYNDNGEAISDISEDGIRIFFKECGFIPAKEDDGNSSRLYKFTRR